MDVGLWKKRRTGPNIQDEKKKLSNPSGSYINGRKDQSLHQKERRRS